MAADARDARADDGDPDAPYDPRPLAVGRRVRIRLNGEGRAWYPPLDLFGRRLPGFWATHDAAADGLLGVVVDIDRQEEGGHVYEVRTERAWLHRHGDAAWPIQGDHFARLELE